MINQNFSNCFNNNGWTLCVHVVRMINCYEPEGFLHGSSLVGTVCTTVHADFERPLYSTLKFFLCTQKISFMTLKGPAWMQ